MFSDKGAFSLVPTTSDKLSKYLHAFQKNLSPVVTTFDKLSVSGTFDWRQPQLADHSRSSPCEQEPRWLLTSWASSKEGLQQYTFWCRSKM
jgi:hypothetical protein